MTKVGKIAVTAADVLVLAITGYRRELAGKEVSQIVQHRQMNGISFPAYAGNA